MYVVERGGFLVLLMAHAGSWLLNRAISFMRVWLSENFLCGEGGDATL